MSRKVLRVPIDFAQPIDKVWEGYLLPEKLRAETCPACAGLGTTPARQWVESLTRQLLMLDEDLRTQAQGHQMHPYLTTIGHRVHARPTPDIAEFGTGLAGREAGFLGHDAMNAWRATDKVIQAAGLDPKAWGMCANCHDGQVEKYEGQLAEAEAWEPYEPPVGDGWQLWETVSEGSPISPVFPDRDGLIHWLTTPAYTWGTSRPLTREQAEAFVNVGHSFSAIYTPKTGLIPGDQFAGEQANPPKGTG